VLLSLESSRDRKITGNYTTIILSDLWVFCLPVTLCKSMIPLRFSQGFYLPVIRRRRR
jgi:hypothetical protein